MEVEQNLHGGVGLVHITKPKFEALQIPVPSLDEQRRIVKELETYRNEIKKMEELQAKYAAKITARLAAIWGEKT